MTNFDFLKKYQQLQKGIMFDKIIDLNFATVSFCKKDKTAFWNNALVNKKISKTELSKVEQVLTSLNRSPAFYFENRDDLKDLVSFLNKNDYKKTFEDSWMFWKGGELDERHFEKVAKVKTSAELEVFLKTFDDCYQENDPQNPYGELGDYLQIAEDSWKNHHASNRVEYFIVYKENEPVAVSTLTNYEDIGYISNVGSRRKVRGEGFGKAASLYCVYKSKQNGNKTHCLATEEGTYPNEFYKRIGFKTRFTAPCFEGNTR